MAKSRFISDTVDRICVVAAAVGVGNQTAPPTLLLSLHKIDSRLLRYVIQSIRHFFDLLDISRNLSMIFLAYK